MFAPTRLFFALRDHADLGLLVSAAAVSVFFAGTPWVIPEIAVDFDVSIGAAGLVSTAQVAGFAGVAFVAGRTLRTSRVSFTWGSLGAALFNGLSAIAPSFAVLVVLRIGAGMAAGLLVWLAWANAMKTSSALRDVAAVGPLTVLVAAPVLAWIASRAGSNGIFLFTAVCFVPAVFFPATFSGYKRTRTKVSPSRSNVVLIGVLAMITMSASGLFVYGAIIGVEEIGMSAFLVSIAYSGNALAGFVAARRHADDIPPSGWVLAMAVAAGLVGFVRHEVAFVVGMVAWGFCFWTATPKILRSIATWSYAPDERVGDAQSAMAVGRSIGPAIAAVLVGDGRFGTLAGVAVVGLTAAAVTARAVRLRRREQVPPVPPVPPRPPRPPGEPDA